MSTGYVLAGVVVRMFRHPIDIVGRMMTPRTSREPRVETLQAWRAALAYLGLVAILVSAKDDPNLSATVGSLMQAPLLKAAIAVPCFLVAVIVLVIMTGAGRRGWMLARSLSPLAQVLGVCAAPVLLVLFAGWRMTWVEVPGGTTQFWVSIMVLLTLPLWPAVGWAMVLGVRYSFRASDIHPFLQALVGFVIGLVSFVQSIVDAATGEDGLGLSLALFAVGGGLVVMALSVYEFWLLRNLGVAWAPPADPAVLGTGVSSREWMWWLVLPVGLILLLPAIPLPSGRSGTPLAPVAEPATAPAGAVPSTVEVPVAAVVASAVAPDSEDDAGRPVSYAATNIVDHDPATAWRMPGDGTGAQITLTFDTPVRLTSVGLIPGYAKVDPSTGQDRFTQNRRITAVTWQVAGQPDIRQEFTDEARLQSLPVDESASEITLVIDGTRAPGDRDFTAISDVELQGTVG